MMRWMGLKSIDSRLPSRRGGFLGLPNKIKRSVNMLIGNMFGRVQVSDDTVKTLKGVVDLNVGDVVIAHRKDKDCTKAYMITTAPSTCRDKVLLTNLDSGDIRGRGKSYIGTWEYFLNFEVDELELLDLLKADRVKIVPAEDVTIAIHDNTQQ